MSEDAQRQARITEFDAVLAREPAAAGATQRCVVADALLGKGTALRELRRLDEALDCFQDVIRRFGDETGDELRMCVARAALKKGNTLVRLGRDEEAMDAFTDSAQRVHPALDEGQRTVLLRAQYGTATLLYRQRRYGAGVEVLADLINPYVEAEPPAEVRDVLAKAMLMAGNCAAELGQAEAAVGLYDMGVNRFGEDDELSSRVRVAGLLASKGATLLEEDRLEDALLTYDQLVGRVRAAYEPQLRVRAAEGLCSRGWTLERLGRSGEALGDYRAVVGAFAPGESAEIDRQIRYAQQGSDRAASSSDETRELDAG